MISRYQLHSVRMSFGEGHGSSRVRLKVDIPVMVVFAWGLFEEWVFE